MNLGSNPWRHQSGLEWLTGPHVNPPKLRMSGLISRVCWS